MFRQAGYRANSIELDLSKWDMSHVTHPHQMFYEFGMNSKSVTLGDLSKWDTSSFTSMEYLFTKCGTYSTSMNIGNIDNWNTSNVTSLLGTFNGLGGYSTSWNIGDLSTKTVTKEDGTTYTAWDVSKVTTMEYTFAVTGSKASVWSVGDISNWDVSNVTIMDSLFHSIGGQVTTLDLSGWNTVSLINTTKMFYINNNLANIYVGDGWNMANVTESSMMFSSVPKLPNYNSSVVDKTNAHTGVGGYLKVKPVTFNFTIDGVTYTAEQGMTWATWVDSSYDTRGFVNNNDLIYTDNLTYALVYQVVTDGITSYRFPAATDLIDAGLVYITFNEGSEDPG